MKTKLAIIAALLVCIPAWAKIDISVGIGIPIAPVVVQEQQEPPAMTEDPPVVFIEPEIYVVPNSHQEIFFTHGFYWTERGGYWYQRSKNHKRWNRADRVPEKLVKMHGHYRDYHDNDFQEKHHHHHNDE